MSSRRSAPSVLAWRNAVLAVFILNGFEFATWVSRIPGIVRTSLDLDDAQVGLLLLCLSAGAILGLSLAPPVLARLGARNGIVSALAFGSAGLALAGIGSSALHTVPAVAIGLAMLGIGNGAVDVMMNVEGTLVERAKGTTQMPLMHAGYSMGTVVGAGIGAGAAALGIQTAWHLTAAAVLVVGGAVLAVRFFGSAELPAEIEARTGASTSSAASATMQADAAATAASITTGNSGGVGHPPAGAPARGTAYQPISARLRGRLLVWTDITLIAIGIVMLGMAFTEGSAGDWLALAVVDGHHQANATGALFYGIFVAAMTIGRVLGGPLVDRLGRVVAIRGTALIGVAGLLLFILGGSLWLVAIGTVLWGFGCALGFPLGMSAAADNTDHPAERVSAVATMGYLAFLVGPPVMGFLAQAFGILNALYLVLFLIALSFVFAGALRHRPDRSGSSKKQDIPDPVG